MRKSRPLSLESLERREVFSATPGFEALGEAVSPATVVVFSVRGITDDGQQSAANDKDLTAKPRPVSPATVVVFSVRGITDNGKEN